MGLDMKIHELIWPQDRIEHIAQHSVTPDEVKIMRVHSMQIQQKLYTQ